MLPTALRCLTFTLRSCRSSQLEVLCDPLQRLAPALRAPLQYTACSFLPASSFATQVLPERMQDNTDANSSYSRVLDRKSRTYCQQPTMRSDNIFTYEGPLQKAVGNLKASTLPSECTLNMMLFTWSHRSQVMDIINDLSSCCAEIEPLQLQCNRLHKPYHPFP